MCACLPEPACRRLLAQSAGASLPPRPIYQHKCTNINFFEDWRRHPSYTPIGYAEVIVGQKRRIAPRLTHDHAEPRFQAVFRTRTGEMSPASPAPDGT